MPLFWQTDVQFDPLSEMYKSINTPLHIPVFGPWQTMRATTQCLDDEDFAKIDECFEWQDEDQEELAFLEESHRLCAPEFDDVGCFVHQHGSAKIWDHDSGQYIPYGTHVSKWPHPHDIFPPPSLNNPDLPEQYVSCDTYECEYMTEHPGIFQGPRVNTSSMDDGIAEAAAIARSTCAGSMNEEEECIGHELVRTTGFHNLSLDAMDDMNNDTNSDWSENTWDTDTPDSPSPGNAESLQPCTPIPHMPNEEKKRQIEKNVVITFIKKTDEGESIYYITQFSDGETCYIPAYISLIPIPHMPNEEKKRQIEKNVVITFIKKTDEGESIYYITQFSDGETCYIPAHISKRALTYGDTVGVQAFITDGHQNKWRAFECWSIPSNDL